MAAYCSTRKRLLLFRVRRGTCFPFHFLQIVRLRVALSSSIMCVEFPDQPALSLLSVNGAMPRRSTGKAGVNRPGHLQVVPRRQFAFCRAEVAQRTARIFCVVSLTPSAWPAFNAATDT